MLDLATHLFGLNFSISHAKLFHLPCQVSTTVRAYFANALQAPLQPEEASFEVNPRSIEATGPPML